MKEFLVVSFEPLHGRGKNVIIHKLILILCLIFCFCHRLTLLSLLYLLCPGWSRENKAYTVLFHYFVIVDNTVSV